MNLIKSKGTYLVSQEQWEKMLRFKEIVETLQLRIQPDSELGQLIKRLLSANDERGK